MKVNRSEDDFEQCSRIVQQVFTDIPSLGEIWNPVVEASFGVSPFGDHPLAQLFGYVKSLSYTCQQALYSIERLETFCTREASNISEFYVAHYLYDFIVRVKTATDILALIINHIFDIGLPDQACSLESGSFARKLRTGKSDDQKREQLARKLDRVRNSWLGTFDKLRDIVIHQAGFKFMLMGGCQHRIHISIPIPSSIPSIAYDANEPLAALRSFAEEETLIKFLAQINSNSVSEYLITVDPVRLCEELWNLLSGTTEELINECRPEITAFISRKKPR